MILGIDAATHNTGISIISNDGLELIDHRNLFGGDGDEIKRSLNICSELNNILNNNNFSIEKVVLEDILLNKFVPNLNSCRSLIRLQGMIIQLLYNHSIYPRILTANSWKSKMGIMTGPEGRNRLAQKQRAIKLVKNKFNVDVDDNQADAICLALCEINK